MSCPSCGYTLHKLTATTTSGGKFDIEHCGRCCGTWFDPYEINRVPYHEVVRLAKITVLPKNQPPLLTSRLCPRCHKEMKKYYSESIPRGVNFLRCHKCLGLWATQKDLEVFKKKQEEKVTYYKDSKSVFPSLSMIFVPALFITLLFFSTFITLSKLDESKESRIKAAEVLNQLQAFSLSPATVSITFRTNVSLCSMISYGPSSLEMKDIVVSDTPTVNHQVLLTGLEPDAVYQYKIVLRTESGEQYVSDTKTFVTKKK